MSPRHTKNGRKHTGSKCLRTNKGKRKGKDETEANKEVAKTGMRQLVDPYQSQKKPITAEDTRSELTGNTCTSH